jgi:hypothetical protein
MSGSTKYKKEVVEVIRDLGNFADGKGWVQIEIKTGLLKGSRKPVPVEDLEVTEIIEV